MNREELIEEMLLESGLGAVRGGRPTPGSVERMKVAVAVFEQAHAPTDNERGALLSEMAAWQRHTGDTALANLLKRGQNLLTSMSDALGAMTAEKELWRKRCAEETIAWADEATKNQRLQAEAERRTVQGES